MTKQYTYPIDLSWSTDDMTAVLHFLTMVEDAYEHQVKVTDFLNSYATFKTVVRSKSEEKRLEREFEQVSGYSIYRAVKAAQEKGTGVLRLER
ncbi:UPF0223 family protein [Streptococcus entericus]|uniref:UPF0223 family protein n=1 Tax=Streptococcus entericus TaxID=155680 RepID=UPI000364EC81|nr:UPF0223 family protein [Streptococcus entericus]